MVRLRDRVRGRLHDGRRLHGTHAEGAENQHETREGGVGGDGLQPVVVQIEEVVGGSRRLQHVIGDLLHLRQRHEGQVQLAVLQNGVGEVHQLALHRVHQVLARHDDLSGQVLHRRRVHQRTHLLRRLELGQLREALLARPHGGVDHLQEQLAGARVDHRHEAVHGLGGGVALEGLVHGDTVHVAVVDEPRDLVVEQLLVVLAAQHRLRRLARVQLQSAANAVTQHRQRGVRLHDTRHRALQHILGAGDVVPKAAVHVVRQIDAEQHAGGRRVLRHGIGDVVVELGATVALDVVRIVVAPAQLHVEPVLLRGLLRELVLVVVQQRRLAGVPAVCGAQNHVGSGAVHLVRLARVHRHLLHTLDRQVVQLLIEHLTQVRHHVLVDLLP